MSVSRCKYCEELYDQDTDVAHEEMCSENYKNQGPFAAMNKDVGEFNNKVDDLISNLMYCFFSPSDL